MASIIKCDAAPRDLVKILRGNISKLDPKDFLILDYEQVVINYSAVLVDIFGVCSRPTAKLIEEAATLAFDKQNAHGFAQALTNAIKLCRGKVKSMTSGKKQHPAVFAVLKAMKSADGDSQETDRSRSPPRLGKFAASCAKNRAASSPPKKIRPAVDVNVLSPASRRASIFASFGLIPDNAASRRAPSQAWLADAAKQKAEGPFSMVGFDDLVDICSSQEDSFVTSGGGSSSSTAKAPLPKPAKIFLDSSILKLVRHCGGNRQVAIMSAGASGFMEGRFENEPEVHFSEVPNILYAKMYESSARVMNRPAARMKAPAPVEEPSDESTEAASEQEGEEEEEEEDLEMEMPFSVA